MTPNYAEYEEPFLITYENFYYYVWLQPSEVDKWVPGIFGNLVVKSKLLPRIGSSLEAVEPHP